MSDRKKAIIALVASAIFHVVVALLFLAWSWIMPQRAEAKPTIVETLEVTLMPPEPNPEPAATPEPPPIEAARPPTIADRKRLIPLDADGLKPAETPPPDAIFESDRNSIAASELPATGDVPLPNQQGKERPFQQFEDKSHSIGEPEKPPGAPEAATTSEPTPTATPGPTPTATPEPPKPEATPALEPPPVPARSEETLAFATPSPTPSSIPRPSPVPREEVALLKTQPAPRREPGYSAQTEKTRIEGNISNRGKAGAAAVATPLGRYRKSVADAIGSVWYRYIDARLSLLSTGSVHIKFQVNARGVVENVRVVPKPTNTALEMVSIQSVWEARLPPLPPDLAPTLDDGKLEIDYTFTLFPN